jgi:outer membrane protein OmpA-like peptidoglycan-associated protein
MNFNSLLKVKEGKREDYWVSFSDLMSGLMIIFLFIAVTYMNSITKGKEKIEQIAIMWNQTQENLYQDLFDEFEADLSKWKASIDSETISIRFEEPSVFFDSGSANLTRGFQEILDDFFPRYLNTLSKYTGNIAEVRIEGHTSSEWIGAKSGLDAYFRNMELSQNRTRSVLQYCLTLPEIERQRDWAIKTITANGLSSSSPITAPNGEEDFSLSRRVEFRVRTDAEQRIVTILEGIK